jgi:hypothetical protein
MIIVLKVFFVFFFDVFCLMLILTHRLNMMVTSFSSLSNYLRFLDRTYEPTMKVENVLSIVESMATNFEHRITCRTMAAVVLQ